LSGCVASWGGNGAKTSPTPTPTRARAAIRAHVLPRLRELRPRAAERAARSAALLADASALVDGRVAELLRAGRQDENANGQFTWSRAALRQEPALVLGGLLQVAVRELVPQAHGDKLSGRVLDPVVAAIRSEATVRRRFRLGCCSVEVASKRLRRGGLSVSDEPVRILIVGHCGPDSYALRSAVSRFCARCIR
jgi:hypothetical protein